MVIVASLQYQFWWGEAGYLAHQALLKEIGLQQKNNQELTERNRVLAAEIYDLKNGNEAIEEHARLDLGLIKPYEVFVQMSTISTQYQPIFVTTPNTVAEESNDAPSIEP